MSLADILSRSRRERGETEPLPIYQEAGRAPNVRTVYSELPQSSLVTKPKRAEKSDLRVHPVMTIDRDLVPQEFWIWMRSLRSKCPHLQFLHVHLSSTCIEPQYIFLDTRRNVRIAMNENEVREKIK